MHVEWYDPNYPPDITGQARGNSGTVWWNGRLVHDDVPINGSTVAGRRSRRPGHLKLRDH